MSNYDPIAGVYAEHFYRELEHKPFDREFLDRFAGRMRERGPACDLGCGPGQIGRYLRDRGVAKVIGLDRSRGMLKEAARLNPDIPFMQGDMHALGIRASALGGIAACYSIIHACRDRVVHVLSEMKRVLCANGELLISFHLGEGVVRVAEFHGHAVDLEATLFTTDEMSAYLGAAGFAIEKTAERDPYPDIEYQGRRAYILACNPA